MARIFVCVGGEKMQARKSAMMKLIWKSLLSLKNPMDLMVNYNVISVTDDRISR